MTPRHGFVLVLSLLLVLVLALGAAGLLAVAERETQVAAAADAVVRARRLAEAAARSGMAGWSTRRFRAFPVGSSGPADFAAAPAGTRSTVDRLDSALFLIRSEARVPGGRGREVEGRAGMLVATLDAAALAVSFPAAVTATARAEIGGGEVSGVDGCGGGAEAGVLAPEVEVVPQAVVAGSPAVRLGRAPLPPTPDPFAPPLVDRLATIELSEGEGQPRPRASGSACVPGPWNWGAISSGHPCHGLLPVVRVRGDLMVGAGELRGVLVVDGDLRVAGSARFEGIILVGGRLLVEEDARLTGAVRAAHVKVTGGRVRFDACAVDAALQAPALDQGFRPPFGRWWVPIF